MNAMNGWFKRSAGSIASAGPQVQFDQVSLQYGQTRVLEGIDLTLSSAEVHALVGPNGGGKSSLVRCLLGLAPHRGTIKLEWPGSPGQIGYVPQALEFDRSLPMSVIDFLAAMQTRRPAFLRPGRRQRQQIVDALERVGLGSKAERRMGDLSGGERQRVMMAQGLMPEPKLLILDEPMAALDEAGVAIFEALIGELKAEGVTLLWVEHDLAAVRRLADRVTGLNRRLLFSGDPAEELTPERVLDLFSSHPTQRPRKVQQREEQKEVISG